MLRNVTITLDEETAQWARIEAARRDTSVSRLVGELLRRYMEESDSYASAMNEFLTRRPRKLRRAGERYPSREKLHER